MTPQAKLSEYDTTPAPEEKAKEGCYNCWNCKNKQDVLIVQGRQMVRCFGSLKPFRERCALWSDGREVDYMIEFSKMGGKEDANG